MSERNVKLFYNEMCKNEKLQNEIQEVLGVANTESDKQALLNDIAKKYNFDFTPEEAKKFAENLSRNELSLDDLSEVSGGFGRRTAVLAFTALTALGSLGSAGAIVSHADKVENVQNQESGKEASAGVGIIEEEYTQDQDKEEERLKKEREEKAANKAEEQEILDNLGQMAEEYAEAEDAAARQAAEAEDEAYEGMREMIETAEEDAAAKQAAIQATRKAADKIIKKQAEEEDRAANEAEEREMLDNLGKMAAEDAILSEIINEDNKNIFEGLVCETNDLQLLYRMTRDGYTSKSIMDKVEGNSNIVVLIKTDEGKTFGGYISCELEHGFLINPSLNMAELTDNESFLYSIDLNEKFNIKKGHDAMLDPDYYGFAFGYEDLIIFNPLHQETYSGFGNEYSSYETNGITIDEFIGGKKETRENGKTYNKFKPIEIEIFRVKRERQEIDELFKNADDNTASRDGFNPEIKKLANNLKYLYQDYDNSKYLITSLFKNSNYNWYHHEDTLGSYYLLENKSDKNDRYYLSQRYSLFNDRKVIYYKEEKFLGMHKTENLNNQYLEKELHQRRLFRNALQEIEAEAESSGKKEMKKWATELKNEIMPDKPDDMNPEDFYKK